MHEIEDLLVDPKTGKYYWRHERPPIWYCAHTLGPLLTLMDDRIVEACGMPRGLPQVPRAEDHRGFLDIEVGLFQTQKGAIDQDPAQPGGAPAPHMVCYSLYGTKGYIETGREGGWGDTQGRAFFEDEMTKEQGSQPIECPTV